MKLHTRWFPVLILAVACSSAPKNKLSAEDRGRNTMEIARGAMMENDPTTALRYLRDAEKEIPSDPELHHIKALAYYAKNLLVEATLSAQKAVELQPEFSDAQNTLGRVLLDQNRFREAEGPLLKAATDPIYRDAFKARTNLGILYYRQNEFEKAEEQFELAVKSDTARSCVAYYYKGNLALRKKNYDSAMKNYRTASMPRNCGGFVEAQLALGTVFARMKNYDEARKHFLEIRKNYPDTQYADQAMHHLQELP